MSASAATLQQNTAARREARLQTLESSGGKETTAELRARIRRRALAGQSGRLLEIRMRRLANESGRDTLADQILGLVNVERLNARLQPLKWNDLLASSALAHAKDMDSRNYFNHITPEGDSPEDRIQRTGYLDIDLATCRCTNYSYAVGENIADGQRTAQEVMDDWMHSEGHKKNILSADFEEIGVGVWNNVWVQNFGRFTHW